MSADPDVVVVGRIGIDLYPQQPATPLKSVTSFSRFLGGSATNVAVAAARLGLVAALVSKVGRDPFGAFAREECARLGLDTRWLSVHPDLPTPLAFAELNPPDHFPLVFYRAPSAPDEHIGPDDVDLSVAARAPLLWTTGGSLGSSTTRATVMALMGAAAGRFVVHDVDLRPSLWPSLDEARVGNLAAAELADVVVGNRSEIELVTGTADPRAAARRLLTLGPTLVVVKCGPDGALFVTADDVVDQPGVPTVVVNGLGAGDAFGGALCWCLLTGQDLARTASLTTAAGAIVAGRLACAEAMPDLDELFAAVSPDL